jgi:hypothetical protein
VPQLHTAQLAIPFGGRTPRSRQASLHGARVCRAGSQAARLLIAYLQLGARTDSQMAETLGLPEARISARRSGLMDRRLVAYSETVQGPYGTDVCRWILTRQGQDVARVLAGEVGHGDR